MTHAKLVLHGIADIEAVFLGHHDIEENQIRFLGANGFERFFSISRRQQFHAIIFELFQGLLDQRAEVRFVVNDEDFHRRHW